MAIFQTRDVLCLDVKIKDVRHVLEFLYITVFIQQLLAKDIIFRIQQKATLIVNPII